MTKAVITQLNNQRFLLIYEEGELVECHSLQASSDIPCEKALQIGNIYIGRVEKVVKNIQAAFLRLDNDNIGYLPLDDKCAIVLNRKLPKGLSSITEGDKVLVQVEQEPQKMKQARVTGNICFSGNYVALDLSEGRIGVSKKIKDKECVERLRALIEQEQKMQQEQQEDNALPLIKNYGCVLRTACEKASDDVILREYRELQGVLDEILHKAQFERNTGCLYGGKPEYISLLMDYGIERMDEIQTDLPEIYEDLKNAPSLSQKESSLKLVFYEDTNYALAKLLSLETELNKLLNKKVWLKSGGFLVIEPTEAMVVIDVNTGKSIGKKNSEQHILKINMEAATEIMKQLRLRNLSGIIMIDFINMKKEEDKQRIVGCLKQGLQKDKVPGCFVEITKLDVFELTRKKVRKPLHEAMKLL